MIILFYKKTISIEYVKELDHVFIDRYYLQDGH